MGGSMPRSGEERSESTQASLEIFTAASHPEAPGGGQATEAPRQVTACGGHLKGRGRQLPQREQAGPADVDAPGLGFAQRAQAAVWPLIPKELSLRGYRISPVGTAPHHPVSLEL